MKAGFFVLLFVIITSLQAQQRMWDSVPIPDSLIAKRIDSLMDKQVFNSKGFVTENEMGNSIGRRLFKEAHGEELAHTYSEKLSRATGEYNKYSSVAVFVFRKHRLLLFKTIMLFTSRKTKCFTIKGKKNCLIVAIDENDKVTKADFMREAIKLKDILLRYL